MITEPLCYITSERFVRLQFDYKDGFFGLLDTTSDFKGMKYIASCYHNGRNILGIAHLFKTKREALNWLKSTIKEYKPILL